MPHLTFISSKMIKKPKEVGGGRGGSGDGREEIYKKLMACFWDGWLADGEFFKFRAGPP